jgi:hypothetical protein
MAKALRAIIHEKASAQQAQELFNSVKKSGE